VSEPINEFNILVGSIILQDYVVLFSDHGDAHVFMDGQLVTVIWAGSTFERSANAIRILKSVGFIWPPWQT